MANSKQFNTWRNMLEESNTSWILNSPTLGKFETTQHFANSKQSNIGQILREISQLGKFCSKNLALGKSWKIQHLANPALRFQHTAIFQQLKTWPILNLANSKQSNIKSILLQDFNTRGSLNHPPVSKFKTIQPFANSAWTIQHLPNSA